MTEQPETRVDERDAPRVRRPVQYAIKRALDVVLAGGALLAGSPVLLAIGAAIRLDSPGPALFEHERVGRGGRPFQLLKFRTMATGAPVVFNADGSTRVERADPRVTRVGRHLRGALDELPQLVNVMRGEMSLVGPRPDMSIHATMYTDAEWQKLQVLPGISSLAAVLGRNQIPWKQRIAIDLAYIEHWTLWLDVRIIVQTLCLPLGLRPFDFRDVIHD